MPLLGSTLALLLVQPDGAADNEDTWCTVSMTWDASESPLLVQKVAQCISAVASEMQQAAP